MINGILRISRTNASIEIWNLLVRQFWFTQHRPLGQLHWWVSQRYKKQIRTRGGNETFLKRTKDFKLFLMTSSLKHNFFVVKEQQIDWSSNNALSKLSGLHCVCWSNQTLTFHHLCILLLRGSLTKFFEWRTKFSMIASWGTSKWNVQ